MEESAQYQSNKDLNSFNSSIVQLTELINANLTDPQQDTRELASLKAKVDNMLESVQKIIKTKSERVVEEIIPNYFVNLAAAPVQSPSGNSKKRKLVTFDVEPKQCDQSYHDSLSDIDSMANEEFDSFDFMTAESESGQQSEGTVATDSNVNQQVNEYGNAHYQSYYYCDPQMAQQPMQSQSRAATYAVPLPLDFDSHLRGGHWVEYEELYLKELVGKYRSGVKGKRVVDWSSVARELNRQVLDCKVKWSAMCSASSRTRKGPYRVEEDQLIMTKVQDYINSCGSSSSGGSNRAEVSQEVWEELEQTMGRPAKNIRLRWRITLSKRVAAATSESKPALAPAPAPADKTAM